MRRTLWLAAFGAALIPVGPAATAHAQGAAAPVPDPSAPGHEHAAAQAQAEAQAPASQRSPAPRDAYVYIGWPVDGAVVTSPFKVWFGTRSFGVAPAGVTTPNTGHHHLLIDAPLPPLDQPIPNDRSHLHFGLGQTETTLDLPPGRHTLQLLMGDANHVPHDPPVMSRRITILVRGVRAPAAGASGTAE